MDASYKVGDLVVYGSTGVCKIVNIDTLDPLNCAEPQLYYVLESLQPVCVIYIPVKQEQAITRRIITKDEANKLIDMIPSMEVTVLRHSDPKTIAEHYQSALRSYDCTDLIELAMSIYAKQTQALEGKGKFGAVELKYRKLAEDQLHSELAVALGIQREDVGDYIVKRLQHKKHGVYHGDVRLCEN